MVVDFEHGKTDSIFRPVRGRETTEWSPCFEHGYGHLIDWSCTLDDYKKIDNFRNQFGPGHVVFSGLLVVGRSAGVTDADRARLRWRMDKVRVDSHAISCITFDDLDADLETRLGFYPAAYKAGK